MNQALPTEQLNLGFSSINIMEENCISASQSTSRSAAIATAISETSNSSKTARLLPAGFEPTPYSVIIGRDKQSRNATGTHSLIALAKSYLPRYSQVGASRREKTEIVTEIVNVILAVCPVGAFVTCEKGRWLEVGDLTAREKYVSLVVVIPLLFEYPLNKLLVSTIFSLSLNRVGFVFRSLLNKKSKLARKLRRLDSQEDEIKQLRLQGTDRAGGMSPLMMSSPTAAQEYDERGTTKQPPKTLVDSPIVLLGTDRPQNVCAPPKNTTPSGSSAISILLDQHQTTTFMPPHQQVASSVPTLNQEQKPSRLQILQFISSFDSILPLPLNNHRRCRHQQLGEEEQGYDV